MAISGICVQRIGVEHQHFCSIREPVTVAVPIRDTSFAAILRPVSISIFKIVCQAVAI